MTGVREARHVALAECAVPGCNCYGVLLVLLDEGGRAFAAARISAEQTAGISTDLVRMAGNLAGADHLKTDGP